VHTGATCEMAAMRAMATITITTCYFIFSAKFEEMYMVMKLHTAHLSNNSADYDARLCAAETCSLTRENAPAVR